MNKLASWGLIALLSSGTARAELPLPAGWRIPSREETDQSWRNANRSRFLSDSADFDGDGLVDSARILIRNPGRRAGLVVTLAREPRRAVVLDEFGDPDWAWYAGVAVVRPGKYQTLCGKGLAICGNEGPAELALRHSAISLFAHESGKTFFYYHAPTRQFRAVPISD